MSLSSKPQDFLGFWSTEGNKSLVTLHSLLSFTSGFQGGFSDSPCLTDINVSVSSCAKQIHDRLDDLDVEPGTTFGYSNENLEIAAAMAEAATGLSWSSLYDQYLRTPLNISSDSVYSGNKGAAGNLRISAEDYIKILSAAMLHPGNGTNDAPLLSQQSLLEMNTDHTAEPEVQKGVFGSVCVCVEKGEREGEGERERQRQTESETETERDRDRQSQRQRQKETRGEGCPSNRF